jgi:Protein of unknown function (DUF2971)
MVLRHNGGVTGPDSNLFPRSPETLYHYTSQNGLIGIVNSKRMRASSLRYLNDSAEFNYAIGLVRTLLADRSVSEPAYTELFRQLQARLDTLARADFFVTSFSEASDSLSQWRAYSGEGTGFSMGFAGLSLFRSALSQGFSLHRCEYGTEHQVQTLWRWIRLTSGRLEKQGLDECVNDCLRGIMGIGPRLKHPAFADEQEWRLVGEPAKSRTVRFRLVSQCWFLIAN